MSDDKVTDNQETAPKSTAKKTTSKKASKKTTGKPQVMDFTPTVYAVVTGEGKVVKFPNNPSELFIDRDDAVEASEGLEEETSVHTFQLVRTA